MSYDSREWQCKGVGVKYELVEIYAVTIIGVLYALSIWYLISLLIPLDGIWSWISLMAFCLYGVELASPPRVFEDG